MEFDILSTLGQDEAFGAIFDETGRQYEQFGDVTACQYLSVSLVNRVEIIGFRNEGSQISETPLRQVLGQKSLPVLFEHAQGRTSGNPTGDRCLRRGTASDRGGPPGRVLQSVTGILSSLDSGLRVHRFDPPLVHQYLAVDDDGRNVTTG
jgi:hypothetical protein